MTRLFRPRAMRDPVQPSKVRLFFTPFQSTYLSATEARELASELLAEAASAESGVTA